jgi:hypothetical protein
MLYSTLLYSTLCYTLSEAQKEYSMIHVVY